MSDILEHADPTIEEHIVEIKEDISNINTKLQLMEALNISIAHIGCTAEDLNNAVKEMLHKNEAEDEE